MNELNARDRELARVVSETLDVSAARPDPLLDAALAATRAQIAAQAVSRHKRFGSWWLAGGFAVAACLALVMVLPLAHTATPSAAPTVASSAAMPDADLQLLENMDMLAALGSET